MLIFLEMNWIPSCNFAVSRQFILHRFGSSLVGLIYCNLKRFRCLCTFIVTIRIRSLYFGTVSITYFAVCCCYSLWGTGFSEALVKFFESHTYLTGATAVMSILLIFKNLENNRTKEINWLTNKHPCFVTTLLDPSLNLVILQQSQLLIGTTSIQLFLKTLVRHYSWLI